MSKEAMKLALDALEANVIGTSGRMPKTHEAITALREALAEQPAQQALDKMAENARELGLDYEHPTQYWRAYASDYERGVIDGMQKQMQSSVDRAVNAMAEQPAQQEPVAWYDEEYDCAYTAAELDGGNVDGLLPLYTSPPARKPLTPEWIWTWLMDWCKRNGSSPANYNSLFKMVADSRAIEAAHGIKENT